MNSVIKKNTMRFGTFTTMKYIRSAVAVLGFSAGIVFVGYGANILAEDQANGSEGLQAIVTVSVGALLSIQSGGLCIGGACSDKMVERIMEELKERNAELQQNVKSLTTLTAEYASENSRLHNNIESFKIQNEELEVHSEELSKSASKLKEMNEEYKTSLARSQEIVKEMSERVEELSQIRDRSEHEIEALRALVEEQREQIEGPRTAS